MDFVLDINAQKNGLFNGC